MQKVLELLQHADLRNTAIRREILDLFIGCNHALSHQHIEKQLENQFDRVTLYRTLKTFEEKGLIHRIASDTDLIEYALCKDDCHDDAHGHNDNHAHFRCLNCQKSYCLEEIKIPDIPVPKGFRAKEFQLLVTGFCNECSE